tara:strand:+ start:60 stop:656 length:597 start_codon:yes stop_codon:yes gene_type:complete
MLRKVKLHGELADFVGHKELEAVVNNTADAIRFLVTNFPKLEAHMADRHYQVIVDEQSVDEDSLHNPIGSSDINIVPVIVGSGGNVVRGLLGVALIGLSFSGALFFKNPLTLSGGFAAAGAGAKAAFGIGAALTIDSVASLLFPVPNSNDEGDPRISFNFSGIQNTSRAGTAHPIVYGEVVTGSVVISAGIDTNQVTA